MGKGTTPDGLQLINIQGLGEGLLVRASEHNRQIANKTADFDKLKSDYLKVVAENHKLRGLAKSIIKLKPTVKYCRSPEKSNQDYDMARVSCSAGEIAAERLMALLRELAT